MRHQRFRAALASCAYFFICPGLCYGLFTARLPALRAQTGADEAAIGLILLGFGIASLAGLLASPALTDRLGAKNLLRAGAFLVLGGTTLCGLAPNPWLLGLFAAISGLGMGLVDVVMNTQGIIMEHNYRVSCMSFLHASYSLGGMTGSLLAALFASLGLGPFVNSLTVLGAYAVLMPLALGRLEAGMKSGQGKTGPLLPLPFFVLVCGVLGLLAYAAEGSVEEWGSLLLFGVKGASQSVAALVFAVFAAATVCCRLLVDRLRGRFSDFAIVFCGMLLAICGMGWVLAAESPWPCLLGYALFGLGVAPAVPIFFSRAGSTPGISPARASAAVALFGYGGLLFFPPLLGFVANARGLGNALQIVVGVCAAIAAGSFYLRRKD